MAKFEFHGYAIISDDDCIADASGVLPESLMNEADWIYFQAELDLADLCLLGRASHELTPNRKGRRRLVVSRKASGLEERTEAIWWNPSDLPLTTALEKLCPEGARIGVPGGSGAFDLVRQGPGFDTFHLSRKAGVLLPHGRKIFSDSEPGASAEEVLRADGMTADPTIILDEAERVSLAVWRR